MRITKYFNNCQSITFLDYTLCIAYQIALLKEIATQSTHVQMLTTWRLNGQYSLNKAVLGSYITQSPAPPCQKIFNLQEVNISTCPDRAMSLDQHIIRKS